MSGVVVELVLNILLAEDDEDIRGYLGDALAAAGHGVVCASDGDAALLQLSAGLFDVAVLDVRLPKIDGLTLFRRLRETGADTDVILTTSLVNLADAVRAIKEGANDYITKPVDVGELTLRVGVIAEKRRQRLVSAAELVLLPGEVPAQGSIIGTSEPMVLLLDKLFRIARSNAAVLVSGESGTGKELVAREIHAQSSRSSGPFVAVNCAAFPETLLEAELFGHEKGAFTGAVQRREGRFKLAHGGTLLLDEVGEMPLSAQAKLLRVLEDGVFEPLGTNRSIQVDVRIISATHRDLKKRIAAGLFRDDLYYRLNVVSLNVPPLRERGGDLLLLLVHFLRRFSKPGPIPEVELGVWRALTAYPFPGNVREFCHAIQHAVVLSRGERVGLHHLPDDIAAAAASLPEQTPIQPLALALMQCEREQLLRALAITEGKRSKAAKLLGISRKCLWEKIRYHGLPMCGAED